MTGALTTPEPLTAAGAADATGLLAHAVREAARLLDADGAMVYLVDPSEGRLRFAVDAGIRDPEAQQLIRDLSLPVGVGLFGHAIARREAVVTGDYANDQRFGHSPVADRIVTLASIRSMAAAPLVADGEVLGALGAYTSRADDFGDAQVALLRALADHAAGAIANQRLIDRLAQSQAELARRVDAQRTLGEMSTQLTSLRDPSAVLDHALRAAVRLLGGDGGQIGTVAPDAEGRLRWNEGHSLVHDDLVGFTREDQTPVETGVSGRALRERRPSWTDDYLADEAFPHDEPSDRAARNLGIRAVIAAPLLGESGPIGAIGVYAERPAAFDAEDAELLGLLGDQVAIVLTNARLNAEAQQTADLLARRVEAQRSVGEIAARITAIRDPDDVLQRTLDEAVRLLDADGGRIELIADGGGLHWAFGHSAIDLPIERDVEVDPVELNEGVSGRAVIERRVIRTGDYLVDASFRHSDAPDAYIRQHGIRSVMSAPLIGDEGAIGSITVHSQARDAFDEADAELLEVLASQAAIAVTNARLYARLQSESAALARQIDSQRRLLQINQRLLSTLDPASVLELIADGLKSVVWYDNLGVYRVDDRGSMLRPVLARDRNADAVLGFPIPQGSGLTWWSVENRQPVLLNDALNDPRVIQIPNTPRDPEAIIIVPLISGDEVIGAMNIGRVGGREVAFSDGDFEVVQLFAAQAAVAITNARLYEELRDRIDAQGTLAEIAAHIAALRDPQTVLDRAVAEAARLLRAERAQINLVSADGASLDRPITAAPSPPSEDDVIVPMGSGIAGAAAADRTVRWTGDYLADDAFPHDEGDDRIRAQGTRSMMSAPLVGPEGLLGAITVQSPEPDAFGAQHGELLKLLADQAAIALTNARLYAELRASERRYRHLVDYSPDIVWSVDADGHFTFLSDSLETRTGWKPDDLIGKPFTVLAGRGSIEGAEAAWASLVANPEAEQTVRLELPLANGQLSQAEVAMAATVVDGRFAGAHGSVRDISERERLEGDLRQQAAEIAASQERAHLARELHDSVTQALFSMGLTLRSLELLLETDVEAARSKVAELRDLQKDALAEMRTLIFELRPASLETDGLERALRTHATAVQRRTGLALVVDAEDVPRLPLPTEEALYRIGQEAIHNVVKHANASQASVRLTREGDRVRLSVTDDGSGFSPDDVPRGHLGLLGMRQRLDLIGGELRVDSAPGRGTTIEAAVPISDGSAE